MLATVKSLFAILNSYIGEEAELEIEDMLEDSSDLLRVLFGQGKEELILGGTATILVKSM